MDEAGTGVEGPVAERAGAEVGSRDWPLLPWLLAGIGAVAGLAAWLLLDGAGADIAWRVGLAGFVGFAALALGFTLERERLIPSLVFSGLVGLVLGGLAFNLVRSGERIAGVEYCFAAGVLACVLALPLFQADFLRTRFATAYARVHFEVWTDAVAGAGAGAFALLSFGLLWLVHGLLSLVGIGIIEDMMQKGWLAPIWLAGSFGAALGVMREHLKVVGGLQAVALLVLALLAVPLALALLVFLAALIASGGTALWNATDSATPVLLICAAGSWVLVNAVIRDDDLAGSRNRVMRIAALVLALGILPLAFFAAISMGARINQHGLAPERLWALVAIAVAVAFGFAYLVAILRRRQPREAAIGWAEQMRAANLRLAAGVCVLALILSLPLLDFGAISAANQVARLQAGKVTPEDFDYVALRWDFGEAGRRALARLVAMGGEAGKWAGEELARKERTYVSEDEGQAEARRANLRVQTADPTWEVRIRKHFAAMPYLCTGPCVAIDLGPGEAGMRHVKLVEADGVSDWMIEPQAGDPETAQVPPEPVTPPAPPQQGPGANSTVEVRPFEGRQIYVDDQPVGEPFR